MLDNKEKILADFGKRLKELRILKEMSTRKFADKAEIAHATVEKLESGKMNPSYIILLKIADALEVDLNALRGV